MKVSILVPVYGVEKYIERCARSLFEQTFAYKAKKAGMKCLVIDKRPHLGGNVYCENIEGINVHKYGAHIFHTSNR